VLVLDLDNTLWGGVVGEDGLAGIRLGAGSPEGEAYVAFQEYVLALKRKGVVLAVCSKNDEADALEPFERHPEMRIRRQDLAALVADWRTKSECIRAIARGLGVGLDSVVFVDDNPVERQGVRELLPEVDVVTLPEEPALYARALSRYLYFETSALTAEDAGRTAQYRARAELQATESAAGSVEEFYRGLRMEAVVAPFDELSLPRIAQLIGKTNQFNLTTRRHGLPQLEAFVRDPSCVHLYLRLRDRFADHGLVGVLIALGDADALEIESWLMSCRVIGRTADAEMLAHLSRIALERGYRLLRGTYVPTAKNGLVKELYGNFGFTPAGERGGVTTWNYDLVTRGPIRNGFIESAAPEGESAHA
jgi:FkbH-like protein